MKMRVRSLGTMLMWAWNVPLGWGGLAIFERLKLRITRCVVFSFPWDPHSGLVIGFVRQEPPDE